MREGFFSSEEEDVLLDVGGLATVLEVSDEEDDERTLLDLQHEHELEELEEPLLQDAVLDSSSSEKSRVDDEVEAEQVVVAMSEWPVVFFDVVDFLELGAHTDLLQERVLPEQDKVHPPQVMHEHVVSDEHEELEEQLHDLLHEHGTLDMQLEGGLETFVE